MKSKENTIDQLIELTKGCISGKYNKKTGKNKLNQIIKELSKGNA